eukprot:3123145-Pleurochrysis_carterae.AAC.1
MINELVAGDDNDDAADAADDAAVPLAGGPSSGGSQHALKYELECISLLQQIDAQRSKMAALEAD